MNINLYDYIPAWFVNFSISFLMLYQTFCGDVFFNVEDQNATIVERLGNTAFRPVRYLCVGQKVFSKDGVHYSFEPLHNYREFFTQQTIQSILDLPTGIFFGSVLKAVSYISPEVRQRHRAIVASRDSSEVESNLEIYREMGLEIASYLDAEKHVASHFRKPGSENYMSVEKRAMKEIVQLLDKNEIPFWVDCGTCMGAYRYGGVIPWDEDIDLAILMPDAQNVRRILQKELDPRKYFVFNCSSRLHPNSYLKVFVREASQFIDIYHFQIFPETRTLKYLLSLEENIFLPDCWRIRESRFTHPCDFSEIFPLKRADFDGIEVPIPNQTVHYLQARYGENIEPAKIYNELTDSYEKDLSHPYWQRSFVH